MTNHKPKKKLPRDANQLAKSIVDQAAGESPCDLPESAKAAVGRKGGLKGGAARKESLTKSERSEIAKKAAMKRWKKPRDVVD